MIEMIWEWIDRVQDVITLFGVPIAVYLLIRIYINTRKKKEKKVKKEEKEIQEPKESQE